MFDRCNGKHICSHELVHCSVVLGRFLLVCGILEVVIGRVEYVGDKPRVEVVELKPPAWCEL